MIYDFKSGEQAIHHPSGLQVIILELYEKAAKCKFPRGAEIAIDFRNLVPLEKK